MKNANPKAKKTKEANRIPYYRKPEGLSLDQWQMALRKQFGRENSFQIINIGPNIFYSDFHVLNFETKNTYKVSIRSAKESINFCECLDFKAWAGAQRSGNQLSIYGYYRASNAGRA